jgi:Fe-S-cluster containining protein
MLQEFLGLRQIHKYLDETQAHLVKQLGVPVCIPDCGKCCQDNCVTIYSIEASLILSYVIGDGRTKVVDWCRGWLLEKHTAATTYTGIPYGVVSKQLKHEWDALVRTPCPMLTEDKKCYIHMMRPLVCRAYGVTRDAGIGCPRPIGKGESVNSRGYIGGDAGDYLEDEVNKFFGKMRTEHPDYAKVGFLPTMIFRQAREQEFRELIAENKIASAKLVGTDVATQLLWAKQLGAVTNILKA